MKPQNYHHHPRQNQRRRGQGSTALSLQKQKTNNEQNQKVEVFSELFQKTVSNLTIINSDEFKIYRAELRMKKFI